MESIYPQMLHPIRSVDPIQFDPQRAPDAFSHPYSDRRPGSDPAIQVLAALDRMDRSIRSLAQELNCLGFFDDDGEDSPRAA